MTTSDSAGRSGGNRPPQALRPLRLVWPPPTAAERDEIGESVLRELDRLLADIPGAADLKSRAARERDQRRAHHQRQARQPETGGRAGASGRPYLVYARKTETEGD